jgi:hypothetical protein
MADILIIRSNCDPATYGTYWIGDGLVAHLKAKGHTVTELADAATTPGNVQYWLTSTSNRTTKLVIAFDHGGATAFYGEVNNQVTPVITMANVKDLTQGLHVYTFACSTCANGGLGEKAINEGALSWLGYVVPVYVFTDPNTTLFKSLKQVIWSFITKLADGFTLETAEKALRDAYTAHNNDHYVFGYNLSKLLLRKKVTGMTLHSHNRLGGKSLVGTWGGMVDWEPFGSYVSGGVWTFKNDGTWSYRFGGGRWIQIGDTAIWTFSNAPGLVYTCTVKVSGLEGVMGYTTAPPNPGKGRFTATRAASLTELTVDPLIAPIEKLPLDINGQEFDLAIQKEALVEV